MPDLNAATIFTVARTGSRVVRYLIRPAQRLPTASGLMMTGGRDPWLPAPAGSAAETVSRARRAGSLVRRMLGLLALIVLGLLGALLVGPLLFLLGVGTASGSDVAGILLAFTLAAAAFGVYWTARRARQILRVPEEAALPVTLDLAGAAAHDEAALLATLRLHERTLPAPARAALHATAIATRDALRVTAHDQALGRDTYDAQQAARRDLPDLLSVYRAAPPTAAADLELLMQLGHIERRMRAVSTERAGQGQRKLEAHGRYLKDKYSLSEETLPKREN
ncbi:hypothetical protein [Deinococcus aquatilis]|jgi:uncharacterized membrane protein YeaQ/YmgE (transglycosylase-associated protein family)|uniref:hypothetical protein n=1 Tax=Deinococcus aquatilis TaxID=519440 RepID=UPI00037363E0|nr:hypothetical protein [Deinococcus aquatilis]